MTLDPLATPQHHRSSGHPDITHRHVADGLPLNARPSGVGAEVVS